MGGRSNKDDPSQKRSLFKSLFSKPQHAASPSAEPQTQHNHHHSNRPFSTTTPRSPPAADQDPRRASFQVFRTTPAPERVNRRDSALPAFGKLSLAEQPPIGNDKNATAGANGQDSHRSGSRHSPRQDFSGVTPVLTADSGDGVAVAMYFDEYRTNAASYPSSPTSPTTSTSRAIPVLRVPSAAPALSGTLRVTNSGAPFVSPRLAVMLFTGQGRTGIPVNDPEAPSAAGLHSRPIARSATFIWKEPVLVESGTHDFSFSIPLSAGIPPTLNTFSSLHSNRLDVWHSVFVKMRRRDLDHVISRQDLVLHKCPPESIKCSQKTRSKTATGQIAEGMALFFAQG